MKFRKLYWVTEQVGESGDSKVIGVFTSIHDIRTKGIKWNEECGHRAGFRVSLIKLDSSGMPLGSWIGPDFEGLPEDLQQFVATGEFDGPSIDLLVADLRGLN
ncbi:hypothetical protein CCB80_14890 [Armatimonadetes bacterium Uphvl-Ar1]|nr:hypothetical protein CCB80_14890 [Armatimonadetes bacterium Uphvl-Ar1]